MIFLNRLCHLNSDILNRLCMFESIYNVSYQIRELTIETEIFQIDYYAFKIAARTSGLCCWCQYVIRNSLTYDVTFLCRFP